MTHPRWLKLGGFRDLRTWCGYNRNLSTSCDDILQKSLSLSSTHSFAICLSSTSSGTFHIDPFTPPQTHTHTHTPPTVHPQPSDNLWPHYRKALACIMVHACSGVSIKQLCIRETKERERKRSEALGLRLCNEPQGQTYFLPLKTICCDPIFERYCRKNTSTAL